MKKIVYLSTPKIAVPALDYLSQKEDIDCCAVITKIDKPQGRGQKLEPSAIKVCALKNNLPVYQPKLIRKDEELIKKLKEIKPDFFITFAYGQILSQDILDIPKFGTINLHASLLPKYRGANPIQCAIVNGETKTGITTMLTVEELDAGDICISKEIPISSTMNDIQLSEQIAQQAPELLYKTICDIYDGKLKPTPQEAEQATFSCKFCKQDGEIDWCKDALTIHNRIRGLCSFPGCYGFINNKMIKIVETKISDQKTDMSSGCFIGKTKEGLNFATGDGSVITLLKVKPEGKREMSAKDWLNGAQLKIGDRFDFGVKE